jgi:VanZ family protein
MENKNSTSIILYRMSVLGIVCSIILIGVISYVSLISSERLDSVNFIPFDDKGAHMLAYAILGIFLYFSFVRISFTLHHQNKDILSSNWIILPSVFTLVSGVIIGTILEFIQKTVEREFDIYDIVADGLGLLVGCAIGYYVLQAVIKIAIARNR